VRGLINDLITRLEAEAVEESSQKAFCDTEMEKAIKSRDEQASRIEEYGAVLSEKRSEITQWTSEIEILSREIATLNAELQKATEMREEEKASNEKTIADSEAGEKSTKEAIDILTKFYESQEFVQKSAAAFVPKKGDRDGNTVNDLAPKLSYGGDYKGRDDVKKGIVGMLEVIKSDFERTKKLTTDTEEDEAKDHAEYEKDTTNSIDSKRSEKEDKEDSIETNKQDITKYTDRMDDAKEIFKDSEEELKKLKNTCVDGPENYAERVAKRAKEIQALKDALEILDTWNH